MAQRCGVIDSGYRNEIFVPITNTTNDTIIICKQGIDTEIIKEHITYPYGKAIAQLLLIPVPITNVEEITYEELKAIPSIRGKGNLGSSGK
jgi:dUTP pyrophosphatase